MPAKTNLDPELTPATVTGDKELDVAEWPSCPEVPDPQHLMEPSSNVAHVWALPAATEVAVSMPATGTGEVEVVVEPLPN